MSVDGAADPRADIWDLVVVGAGPAGATAALAALDADPRLRVLLLDRATFPRDKSCGDGIAPHVFDVLADIGVTGVADGWAPLRRLELAQGPDAVERPMSRPVWVIPREVFDARLVTRAVQRGAVLRRQRVARVARRDDRVELACGDATLAARVVVGADGAHSVVRAAAGLPSGRRALAIRGYAPTPPTRRGTQVIVYGDRRQPSYAWAFDRGDGLSNVGYGELLDAGDDPPSRRLMLDELDRLLPGTVAAGDRWRGHHLPLSTWRWRQPDGPVLLAGDAAGLVNPLTGEGIYYAVATGVAAGRAAAQAIRAGDPARAGARHRAAVRRLLARHLRHTWAAARLSRRPEVVAAGIRAGRRDEQVFDALVELALGNGLITPRLAGALVGGVSRGVGRRVRRATGSTVAKER